MQLRLVSLLAADPALLDDLANLLAALLASLRRRDAFGERVEVVARPRVVGVTPSEKGT